MNTEQKAELYAMHKEYIEEYREGDIFYHVTTRENAASLAAQGFDPSRMGDHGGCQDGEGFYACWTRYDAEDWGSKLYGWSNTHLLSVVRLSLPGIKLASEEDIDARQGEAMQWGREQGYVLPGDEPSAKLDALISNPDLADHFMTLMGLYLREQGYDGYYVGIETVVILNYALLKAEVFEVLP